MKAQEQQTRNNETQRSAVTIEPHDLVLVDSHDLQDSQEGEQPRMFAMRWLRITAVGSLVITLAHIVDRPIAWKCRSTINLGEKKEIK